jgi:hypothetical protein
VTDAGPCLLARIPVLKAERDDRAGADLGTRLRTNERVDTGLYQDPSEALRLFQGHVGERMRARSRNRMLAASAAAAPSHRCFRVQAEGWVSLSSPATSCVGFRER